MNKKYPIFDKIILDINKAKLDGKTFVIGINGIDGSGKTEFTKQFSDYLIQKGYKTQIIHLDDFHNPKKVRYAGEIPEYEKYFNQSFDCETIVKELLEQVKKGSKINKKLKLLNLETDEYDLEKEYGIDLDTIVLFEGVFLFRDEFIDFLDYKVLIDIPFNLSKVRAKIRNCKLTDDDLKSYDIKYVPAQERYFNNFKPKEIANMLIDNENFESPKVVKHLLLYEIKLI